MIKTELFKLLGGAKKYVWMQVAFKILGLASQIAIAFSVAYLVQQTTRGELTKMTVMTMLAVIAVGIVFRIVADRGESRTAYLASVDVKRILRGQIYQKLLRLGASYRDSVSTSKVVQLAVEGVEQLETYFSQFISQFFYAILAPVILFAVIGPLVSWKVAGILLAFVPLIPVSIMVVQKIAKRLLSKYWGSYTQLGDTFLENLQGLTTLKIYEVDEYAADLMDQDSEDFRVATMNVLKMQLNSTSIMDIGAYGGAAAGMIMALAQLSAGTLTIGGAMFVLLLAAEFFLPMRRLGSYFHVGMNGMAASDNIFELLDLPEPDESDCLELDASEVSFTLTDVGFSYDDDRLALQDVSMELPSGSFTSIVGPSGCGKSTVANLLMGRNRSYWGEVLVNGQEIFGLSENSLMDHVTLVSQASHVFKGTVRDNLLLGWPAATDQELFEVLAEVRLLDFVNSRGGLDAPVAEGGSNLSGGQRQRLVLARALLHETPAYIFDEATSSVDPQSEEFIMDTIRELARTHTVILISHRLANVVGSDNIYYMENGRIAESGTHEELMAAGGPYSRMYNQQTELESYARPGQNYDVVHQEIELCPDKAPAPELEEDTFVEAAEFAEQGEFAEQDEELVAGPPAISVMRRLIRLVRTMMPIMGLAVLLGVLGYLCAIFLTVLAGYGMVCVSRLAGGNALPSWEAIGIALVIMAVARGILHYAEQYCNHYIAFKMLAVVRHKVFAKLRTLAPAKLEGRDKGDLISLITGDVELLEVFYAHTISPIAIAAVVSLVMVVFLWTQHWIAGIIGLVAYLLVGVELPLVNSYKVGNIGLEQRNAVGNLNAFVLDSLYGIDETIQYGGGEEQASKLDERSNSLSEWGSWLNKCQKNQVSVTDLLIQVCSWGMLLAMLALWARGEVGPSQAILATLAMMSSFGPVVALSNLSTTLAGTLAAGYRVLELLDEEPETPEQFDCDPCAFGDVRLDDVDFSYEEDLIISHLTLDVEQGRTIGICGPSGSGKSTICRLIMRFWDVDAGELSIGGQDVRDISTSDLRAMESYVTQDTWLFNNTIANNILLGNPDASYEQMVEAAKKASLDDFVQRLPQGYDTFVGELGDALSDGERQRIGLARAFLHDAPLMLLDEPTSNLDILNEAAILKSLAHREAHHTVVVVSHRYSAMALADVVFEVH